MEFTDQNLTGARFENTDLSDAFFQSVDFSRCVVHGADFTGASFQGVDLVDVTINGEIENLTINGVDVGPLIEAALDRRYPERALMRPVDADGFRAAWTTLGRLWSGTVDRARELSVDQRDASVNGEWSFVETLRHLLFATDSWVRRALQGESTPWHPLGLPWREMGDTSSVPHDVEARPSLEEVLSLRDERVAGVAAYLEGLTDQDLDVPTLPVEAPGWPPSASFTPRRCLLVLLNEEWAHRLYAERDLDVLTKR